MMIVTRHGRTASNAGGLLLGRADPPLDDVGTAQADALAAALPGVDTVVCSPLLRTRQTAAAFGIEPVVDERLIELDYGAWDGRPVGEITGAEWDAWRSDPGWRPPDGESLAELGTRVRAACEDWLERARTGTVVLVTHVSPIKAAVAWALGVGDHATWHMYVAPGSLTRIAPGPFGPSLHSFNERPTTSIHPTP